MRKIPVSFWQFFVLAFLTFSFQSLHTFSFSGTGEENIPKLNNPITEKYLKKNLRKSQPRLVLNPKIEKQLKKQKIRTNEKNKKCKIDYFHIEE